jgi:hypothetical protein
MLGRLLVQFEPPLGPGCDSQGACCAAARRLCSWACQTDFYVSLCYVPLLGGVDECQGAHAVRQQDVGDLQLGNPFDEPKITNVLLCVVPLLSGVSVCKSCVQQHMHGCVLHSPVEAQGAVGGQRAVFFGLPGRRPVHRCVGLSL